MLYFPMQLSIANTIDHKINVNTNSWSLEIVAFAYFFSIMFMAK